MQPFRYERTSNVGEAVALVANDRGARFLAGGTNLLDLMKETVETPDVVVDINQLLLEAIEAMPNGVRIGALARMSDTADDSLVRRIAPAVSEALLASASPQLRNMASIGGNLMQRTRCSYFRDVTRACNKRAPGNGCAAVGGDNRRHAVLGAVDNCICTHPSDLAVALLVVDAVVETQGPRGKRAIPIADFHVLPAANPSVETVLEHGELITGVVVPASALAARSRYLKLRDRASFEFALVSVAASLDVANGTIRAARIALGGVAPKPWRSLEAEKALAGKPANAESFAAAADAALATAIARKHNAFKIGMTKRAIVRALQQVSA
jgi:xanthine dehydrogenase YagS FAD-binding subunit